MVEIGDLLLAMYGATSGDIAISKIKGAINQAILCIRTNQNKKFIESIWNIHVSKILRKYLQGGQGNLSADIVKSISFSFPTLKEQGKIANLISLLDERIATQNKIIEDLKKLKSAIIENHYNQNEKQTASIADLGEPFSVGNLAKDDLTETGMPCVVYGELFTTYGETISQIESHTNKTTCKILSKKGDLLFPSSTTVDAMSLIAPSVINVDGVILGGDMFGIHINHNYNAQYLSYYFNHIAKRQLAKFAKGSTIIHLHYADIEKAKLLLPSLEEQNRMAKYLMYLDAKINIENFLISLLNSQKTHLLRINIWRNRYCFSFCIAFCILSSISVFLSSEDRKVEIAFCWSTVGIFILNIAKSFFWILGKPEPMRNFIIASSFDLRKWYKYRLSTSSVISCMV